MKCEKCGAEKVLNPKTGKMFCKEKCWLKQADRQPQMSFEIAVMDEFKRLNERFDAMAEWLAKHIK